MNEVPRVFISYSHETPEHKAWVVALATRLRNSGIDAILDVWELKPGDDLPHFMETNLAQSKYVLMICTNNYVEKANSGKGGVGYEKMIVTSSYLQQINEAKVIPIIRQKGTNNLPTFLKSKLYLDFSDDNNIEYNFDELVRRIHDAPLYVKPEIGVKPIEMQRNDAPAQPQVNPMNIMLATMAKHYQENQNTYQGGIPLDVLSKKSGLSRLLIDVLYEEAVKLGWINSVTGYSWYKVLTLKGKQYILENNLIQ